MRNFVKIANIQILLQIIQEFKKNKVCIEELPKNLPFDGKFPQLKSFQKSAL